MLKKIFKDVSDLKACKEIFFRFLLENSYHIKILEYILELLT